MPGIAKDDIEINKQGDLIIRAEKGERKYYKELTIEQSFDLNNPKPSYNNGVMEVKVNPIKSENH